MWFGEQSTGCAGTVEAVPSKCITILKMWLGEIAVWKQFEGGGGRRQVDYMTETQTLTGQEI